MNNDNLQNIKKLVRSICSSFPILASGSNMWSEIETTQKQKMIEEFCLYLESEILKLQNGISEIQTSPERISTIQKIVANINWSSESEHKLQLYASLVSQSLTIKLDDDEYKLIHFARLIQTINRYHLSIMQHICTAKKIRFGQLRVYHLKNYKRSNVGLLIAAVSELENAGLISFYITGSNFKQSWSMCTRSDYNARDSYVYYPLNLGSEFMFFIQETVGVRP